LYAGGTRSLLLNGGTALATPFLGAGLVDGVRLYFSSRAPIDLNDVAALDWPLLPPGFQMRHLERMGNAVVIEADTEETHPETAMEG
jgi:riboflavin biosynthesis pyrimidine reductase